VADVNMLLDYAVSRTSAKVHYRASGIQLYAHSNASYLSVPNAKVALRVSFSSPTNPKTRTNPPKHCLPLNGSLHVICKILCNVTGYTAESEIAATYLMAQESVYIVTTLAELDHPQGAVLIQVNKTNCIRFVNNTIKQR